MRKAVYVAAVLMLVQLPRAAPAYAEEGVDASDRETGGLVLFSIGWFNAGRARDPIEYGAEWRGGPRAWKLRLNAGLMLNGDGAVFGFGGIKRDFLFGRAWGTSVGFSAGLWKVGSGRDLGGPIEFRTSVDLFFDLKARSRLALSFYHLSNAGIYEENGGVNSVALLYGRRLK